MHLQLPNNNKSNIYIVLLLILIIIILILKTCNKKNIDSYVNKQIDSNIAITQQVKKKDIQITNKNDNKKNVKAQVKIKQRMEGSIKANISIHIDTIYIPNTDTFYIQSTEKFIYKDKWNTINGSIKNKVATVSFVLENEQEINFSQKTKNLGYISVLNSNPYIKNINISSKAVRIKHPILTTGTQVGVGWDLIRNQPVAYAGGGLNLSINEIINRIKK